MSFIEKQGVCEIVLWLEFRSCVRVWDRLRGSLWHHSSRSDVFSRWLSPPYLLTHHCVTCSQGGGSQPSLPAGSWAAADPALHMFLTSVETHCRVLMILTTVCSVHCWWSIISSDYLYWIDMMMPVFSYIPRNYKWITFTIVQRLFIVDLSLKNLHEDRNYDESWLSPSSCSVDAV